MTDTYLDAVQARHYASHRGMSDFDGLDDEALNQLLLRACEWLDSCFSFAGEKADPAQIRAFPRHISGQDTSMLPQGVPAEIIQAVLEIAAALVVSDQDAEQLLGLKGAVRNEKIGDISVSYDGGRYPRPSRIKTLLAAFLRSASATRIIRQ